MAMTLIADNTADTTDLATISFTSSIDSTYKLYIFKFYDCNPASDNVSFSVQFNAASGSGYNETITSASFRAIHKEDDSGTPAVAYHTSGDQGQGTAFQILMTGVGDGADESCAGELYLFNPSNTTYVKHFYATTITNDYGGNSVEYFVAGYINTTSAIDEVQFKMSSGNMDGVIKMYGVG